MRRLLDLRRVSPEPGPDADEVPHEWAADLWLDPADLVAPVVLEAHGVATVWSLDVNGTTVLSGTSSYAAARADVAGVCVAGRNEVRLRVRPLAEVVDAAPRRPRARWRTMLTDEARLRWVRTSVLDRAPGIPSGPPTVGPFRPVTVTTGGGPVVERLRLRAGVEDGVEGGDGVLTVDVDVPGLPDTKRVTLEVAGPTGVVVTAELPGRADGVRVVVPRAQRWWPHSHGTPRRYAVRLLHDGRPLDLPGDGTGDATVRWVGFRVLGNDVPGSVALRVNDVPVFVRGAVWTPGDLAALDEAVALGLNLVRVSGITGYESDAFHERCDELGLLVWQDLMFATYDYPLADDGFRAVVEVEVREQADRLVGHPSTVVVCGSAEHEQQAALFGVPPAGGAARELAALTRPLVEGTGLDVVWVDSSPTGGALPTHVGSGVAQYFGVGAYLRDLPDARHAGVRFAAECLAFSHLPDGPPPEPGTALGVPRDNGADWDFADVRRHYLHRRYGDTPTHEQEQRVTGEVMAEVMGEWRRPASTCSGGIVLWLRDRTSGAGWGLLDHAGTPKPAARALAPTLAPTAVWLVDEGFDGLHVHVAHDPPDPVEVTLRVALVRADGSVVDEATTSWTQRGHGHRVLGVDALLGRFADSSYAHRFGPPAHDRVEARISGGFGERRAVWRVPPASLDSSR